MFIIPRRLIRMSQPQHIATIGTKLRPRLAWTPVFPLLDQLNQLNLSSSGVTFGLDKVGKTGIFNGSAYVEIPDPYCRVTGDWTIVSVVRSTSVSGVQIVASRNYHGSQNSVQYILCLGGQPAYNGAAFFNGGWNSSGIGSVDIRGDNKWHVVAGTCAVNSVAKYFVDGVLASSSAVSGGQVGNPTSTARIGQYQQDTVGLVGDMALFLLFDRALSDAEIRSLSDNPWQIFEEEEDYLFVPIISGGGGPASITGIVTATLDSITTGFSGKLGHSGNLVATLQDISCTMSANLKHTGTSAITLSDISASFTGAVTAHGTVTGIVTIALADITSNASGTVKHAGTMSASLADIMVSMAGTAAGTPEAITGTLAISLEGIGFTASGNSGTITLTADDIIAIKNAIMSDPKMLTVPKFIALK